MTRDEALKLVSGQVANFRPVGEDFLVPGQLYRSGSLSILDEAGWHALGILGIRTVIDLRGPQETEAMPVLPPSSISRTWLPILADDDAPLHDIHDERETVARIVRAYRRIVDVHGNVLARLVRSLAQRETLPAVIFCTAGKDRTGIAVAMLLRAIGISPALVEADYLATNTQMRPEHRETILGMASRITTFAMPKGGAVDAMLRADPAYLAAALNRIGDPVRYLEAHDVSPANLADLARALPPRF